MNDRTNQNILGKGLEKCNKTNKMKKSKERWKSQGRKDGSKVNELKIKYGKKKDDICWLSCLHRSMKQSKREQKKKQIIKSAKKLCENTTKKRKNKSSCSREIEKKNKYERRVK